LLDSKVKGKKVERGGEGKGGEEKGGEERRESCS
jgi:hypothetical protein